MRVLLDENFPLQLYRRLRESGHEVEHIIALGRRGISDAEIMERLAADESLIFLTQDTEFEDVRIMRGGKVIISRVPQRLPIDRRVEIWLEALEDFLAGPPEGRLFELRETGSVTRIGS